ncbi:nodulin homeobox isoform X1 [Daucus carota subsp. sativus]|uniref:nodulin homeobox isoform X1 n=1 Tax=Daucus carota subsp. sativus TaxID=79200 RepID=UPI0007B2680C|nr:PREDICTED: nodulin homeobox isoform X1 [Daucus carota subsp. sativus]
MKSVSGRELIGQVNPKDIDLISAVRSLHSCQDLSKVIRDSDNGTSELNFENGSSIQIDVEVVARIPAHILARLVQSELDEELLKYVLAGIRLLHSLYDAALRHHKLEQILLDDIPLLSQLIEMIFHVLILLNCYTEEHPNLTPITLLRSTIAASSLFLFEKVVSPYPAELANVLVSHPKVHRFVDAAFAVVRVDIEVLRVEMQSNSADSLSPTAEESIKHLCVQCEASLKFLHSLCQQNNFRDCLLKHKELCDEAGILCLVRSVLDLDVTVFVGANFVVGAISRMQSKVLAMLLYLCESESISYLDVVARTPHSLSLAKSVVLKVLGLLRKLLNGRYKMLSSCMDRDTPRGLLQLNALRLVDIFSDDSNFQSYVMEHMTGVLMTLFSLKHREFLSTWCTSDLQVWEEDATLDYDPFLASGWVLNLLSLSNPSNITSSEYNLIPNNMPRASYAHQRTSLLVKIIANLHCFIPHICNVEKNFFLDKFFQCLQRKFVDLSNKSSSDLAAEKIAAISRNFRSFLSHAESLIPSFLVEEDMHLLRTFVSQLEPLMSMLELEVSDIQEAHSIDGSSPPCIIEVFSDQINRTSHLKEVAEKTLALQQSDQSNVGMDIDQANDELREYKRKGKDKSDKVEACGLREIEAQNVESSGSDSSSTRVKKSFDQSNDVQEDQKIADIKFSEKQQRKRKRNIMNDVQAGMIENALIDIPDLHRNAPALQSWADRLSDHGSEVTSSQLKNWLNNRKAKLARVAKDACGLSEADSAHNDNQGGSEIKVLSDSSGNPVEDLYVPSAPRGGQQDESGGVIPKSGCNENHRNMGAELVDNTLVEGQYVLVVDGKGTEIGKGKVYQVHGIWNGKVLEELGTCVVDIIELKGDKLRKLPHPYEDTGTSFYNAEKQHGVIRVLWNSEKLLVLQR